MSEILLSINATTLYLFVCLELLPLLFYQTDARLNATSYTELCQNFTYWYLYVCYTCFTFPNEILSKFVHVPRLDKVHNKQLHSDVAILTATNKLEEIFRTNIKLGLC